MTAAPALYTAVKLIKAINVFRNLFLLLPRGRCLQLRDRFNDGIISMIDGRLTKNAGVLGPQCLQARPANRDLGQPVLVEIVEGVDANRPASRYHSAMATSTNDPSSRNVPT